MPSEISKLFVTIGADTREFQDKMSGISKSMRKVGGIMTGMGAAVTGVMGLAVKAAADEEAGITRLSTAMRNVGIEYDDVKDSLEAWINTQQQKTSVADDKQRDSLASLIRMTGDLEKAQDMLTLAMDVAVGTNKDLESANQMVMYAMGGNWGMVERYIPALKNVEAEEEKWALFRKLFAGQAEEYGKTMAGSMELMKNNMGDVMEAIGSTFLPILTDLSQRIMPLIEQFKTWTAEHPKLMKAIVLVAGAIGGLMMVLGPLLIVLPGLISSLPLLAGAFTLLLGPVGLVIAAIAAASAVGITLWQNWDRITHDIILYWNRLVDAANTAFGFIGETINTYLIEPVLKAWELIKQFLAWVRGLMPKGGGGGGKGPAMTPEMEAIAQREARTAMAREFQFGGVVPGLPSQAVPAVLHGGEYVFAPGELKSFASELRNIFETVSMPRETLASVYLDGERVGEAILRRGGEKYAQLSHIGGLNPSG